MKKADFMVFFSILALAVLMLFAGRLFGQEGDTVIITQAGEIYGEYPLTTDAEIPVGDGNTVKI